MTRTCSFAAVCVLACSPVGGSGVKTDVPSATLQPSAPADAPQRDTGVTTTLPPGNATANDATPREVAETAKHPRLWVYEPPQPHETKLPLVLIAPAGSNCLTGMPLGSGDSPEHRPWAEAGFLVVAYELRGAPLKSLQTDFGKTMAGTLDGMGSLQWALDNYAVDQTKILAVGHSSAATHALTFGSIDTKVTQIVAFAPVLDIAKWHGAPFENAVRKEPQLERFVRWASPGLNPERIDKPVFLFVSEDDDNVAPSDVRDFAQTLLARQAPVTLNVVSSGGHYEAMLARGIPEAIQWAATGGVPPAEPAHKEPAR